MSASNALESAVLRLLLLNEAFAGIGDAGGVQPSATAGNVYASLHTADPAEAGNQATSEATYAGYARVAIPRSSAGWTEANGSITNVADINWPAATGGPQTVTHVCIGTAATGAGVVLTRHALSNPASLVVDAGIAPKFAASKITIAVD